MASLIMGAERERNVGLGFIGQNCSTKSRNIEGKFCFTKSFFDKQILSDEKVSVEILSD